MKQFSGITVDEFGGLIEDGLNYFFAELIIWRSCCGFYF
jgi:hypothetical protein